MKVSRALAGFALFTFCFFHVDVVANVVNCVYRFTQGWSCSRHSDLLLSPFQAFGVSAIVSEGEKLSVGDIVLVRGTPVKQADAREDIWSPPTRILRVLAVEGDSVLYNGCEIVIRKDHVWVESDFKFPRTVSEGTFHISRLWDNAMIAYKRNRYISAEYYNRHMRSSRDFGQMHVDLCKKVNNFYKTMPDFNESEGYMSYEEVMRQLGYQHEVEKWRDISTQANIQNEDNSEKNRGNLEEKERRAKVIIDNRVPFRERALPEEHHVDVATDMGGTLPDTDEEDFKNSILGLEMKPVSYRKSKL